MRAYHKMSFVFLLLAFLVSAAYQYYRSLINEVPDYDTFGLPQILIYLGLIALSGISLIDKKIASQFIIGFCIVGYMISFAYYFPIIWIKRTNNWVDIMEAILYLLFLLLAAVFSLMALRKRKRLSNKP